MSDQPLIVGVGASAGGLEAFSRFLENMTPGSGMAFVLVQHLDPEHESMLVDLLRPHTELSVGLAEDGARVTADQVYVIPPNATLTLNNGYLRVATPAPPRAQRHPIDTFFESLAADQGENAVCVVLSGAGTDGTAGVAAAKAGGGLTLAQAEADHDAKAGMPQSAVSKGQVDYVLPLAEMAQVLHDYHAHLPMVAQSGNGRGESGTIEDYLGEISRLLRVQTGHDFSEYKDNTRLRRIQRRMQVLRLDTPAEYVERLRSQPAERDALFHELLISVTQFFRDPEAWDALAEHILPQILAGKTAEDSVRVWVAGCASGEEAYSTAILLKEAISAQSIAPQLKIFGTDLAEDIVSSARDGWFVRAMVKGVSAARLARWFNEEGGGYRPSKDVREACIFSIHDLARDPPFSRLDLVICRNLLIYMSAELQKRILHKFHYALKPQGYLFLGSSENVGSNSELFTQVDKKHRLFQRRETNQPVSTDLSLPAVAPQRPADASADEAPAHSNEYQIEHEVRRVMDPYGPAYFAVDTQHQILRFSGGSVGQYLEPASGVASLNLFDLLKQALRPAVRSALHEAFENRQAVTRDDLALHLDGRTRPLDLIVEFIPANRLHGDLCVVAFRQVAPRAEADTQAAPAADRSELEQKLHATQSELRAANAELVALQEDSKAVTEEYQSINEELQSSNEELETSKEELQSVNEELQTVNNELEHKNQQLGELNSDLRNLLESTEIATIFLDKDFRIKNYTPAISDLFYLRASDVNRPLSEITGRLDYSALKRDVETVLRKLTVVEREVSLDDGRTFIMNIRLYRTVSDVINGVVITFFDISERKRYEAQRAWLAAIVEGSYEAILSADLDGYITTWNAAAERIFGYSQGEALGQPLPRFLVGQDEAGDDPELAAIWRLEDQPTRLERTIRRKDGQPIEITLTASLVKDQSGQATAIALVVQDITERSHEEAHRELLLHELSHRVKNMLATIQAIMNQTLNRAPSLEAFGQVFSQRLQGLAQTHSLLSQSEWQGVDLRQLVETTLEPYAGAGDNGYQVRGPDLTLAPQQAVSLGMALHELTTNAVKYGALAAAGGHIDIAWERVDDESGPMLKLRWQENTKQPIEAPANKGLGRTLIEDGLAHELDAQVGLEFKTQGAHCGIDMPLQPSH